MTTPARQRDADSVGRWVQVTLWSTDWQAAERMALTHLAPALSHAEQADGISRWWFVRKADSWRVRWEPGEGQAGPPSDLAALMVRRLLARGAVVQRWAPTTYEPEIHAFGGSEAMEVAHTLFHADSRHVLDYLRRDDPVHRVELALLLGSRLARAAGQDYYEQGDIWARVAAHRSPPATRPPGQDSALRAAARRLITARTYSADTPLAVAPGWAEAFEAAGHALATLAADGTLTRGLRAVLAHHLLFAWNRAGIPATAQARLADCAAQAIFDTDERTPGGRPACNCPRPAATAGPTSKDRVTFQS